MSRPPGHLFYPIGVVARAAALLTALVMCEATPLAAAIIDFSMPLQNITATVSTGIVTLSVFDPAQGKNVQTNVVSSQTTNLVIRDGIAAWQNYPLMDCFVYDAFQTNWVGGSSFTLGGATEPRINKGIVAWTEGRSVSCRVYDQSRKSWTAVTTQERPGLLGFNTADGVVMWSSDTFIGYLTYDVASGSWKQGGQSLSFGGYFTYFFNTNGVVAWTVAGSPLDAKSAVVYDPNVAVWRESSSPATSAAHLGTENGVVTWIEAPLIYFQVYDPSRRAWMTTNGTIGSVPAYSISNSTVYWRDSTTGNQFVYGYNPAAGQWEANLITRPLAYFTTWPTNGNAPLSVYFTDMSIGAIHWSWNFDDGSSVDGPRSVSHGYLDFAQHRPALTVMSATGQNSSANRLIRSDATPPVGRLLINGGDSWTTNTAVTLQLSATDNSGIVSSNRFSNDNTNWTAWENFMTNKSWVLTPGYAPKTVFAQLSDAVGNFVSVGSSILFYTNAPPTVSIGSMNVSEGVRNVTVPVTLDRTSAWPVSVNYVVTNGTATWIADYIANPRPLIFSPGSTAMTFQVLIASDALVESNETVLLGFANLTNASAGTSGVLTILDDDTPPLFGPLHLNQDFQFQMTITTFPGRRVTIQASETFSNWISLITLTNSSGSVEFIDPTSPQPPYRFYRALLVP